MNHFFKIVSYSIIFCGLLAWEFPAAYNPGIVAIVIDCKGDFQLIRRSSEKNIAGRVGQLIQFGDTLKTSKRSRINLKFLDDAALLRLDSNSCLIFNGETGENGLHKNVELKKGQLWYEVENQRGDFRITTPQMIMKLHGTQLYAKITQIHETKIWVIKGEVLMENELGNIILRTGQTGIASKKIKPQLKTYLTYDIPNFGRDARKELIIPFKNENGDEIKLIITFIKE